MRIVRLSCAMVIAATVLRLPFVSPARGEDAREIAKKSFPSVAMLVMQDDAGQLLALGSGFFVQKDTVATNLHVVAGAARGYAKIVGREPKYDIVGLVASDQQRDLVLLKIKDANAPGLSPGDSGTVAVGDEIFVIGNPQGLEGTFSKGIVSAVRSIGQDSLLQITAPISPGSSGGPVLNNEGRVVGVAVATFKEGQNLNFAIPATYLSALMADMKPVIPLKGQGKAAEEKSKSLLSDMGSPSTEGVVGCQFVWDEPLFQEGSYSFTIRNDLQDPVRNIICLVVFCDADNRPIDVDFVRYSGIIPGHLAKRVKSRVDESVQKLTTRYDEDKPHTKLEFRVLDFQIGEAD